MLELVDKHGLEPCVERRAGSIPVLGTRMTRAKLWKKTQLEITEFLVSIKNGVKGNFVWVIDGT